MKTPFCPTFDFSQFRYFEKYTIFRCDRRTHEACVFDEKTNAWKPICYNLDCINPHAIDMMDYLERSCRNLGYEMDKDGFEWDTFSELVLREEHVSSFELHSERDIGRYMNYTNYPFARNYSYCVLAAAHLAQELHRGQTDKAGKDYFSAHLLAVGALGQTWKEQVVGLLHDAAEDTPHTVAEVVELLQNRIDLVLTLPREPWIWEMEQTLHLTTGASCDRPQKEDWDEIAQALTALNHHLYPSREQYIEHIQSNPLATRVKLNDLTSNMDLSRIPNPTSEDIARTERYKREYEQLIHFVIYNAGDSVFGI